jgi:ubiquinone/menaquinone biosynthesis C-methylase UbiE
VRIEQERVDRYFRREASFWDELYEADDVYAVIHRERRERALRWVDSLGLPAGARVLEVGCGAGGMAIALAERGFDVDATDAVDAMVELACQNVERSGVQLRVSRADAQSLPFEAASFQLAVALGVIPWLPDPPTALHELDRVVAPGGRLVISADNRGRLTYLLDPARNPHLAPLQEWIRRRRGRASSADPGSVLHRPAELDRLLGEAGFEVEKRQTLGFGPFTLLGRNAIPAGAGVALHERLQRRADRSFAPLRNRGTQCVVLARRRA